MEVLKDKRQKLNERFGKSGIKEQALIKNLTKREYFAGLFLQATLSNPACMDMTAEGMVRGAVECADDLLKELNKK